ncbi:MAG: efflux RND transporter periplasmic adaptor subunit [Alphaproteobacteria bacterium]
MTEGRGHPILRAQAFWPTALASAAGIAALAYALWSQNFAGRLAAEHEVRVKVAAASKITVPAIAEGKGRLRAFKETDVVSRLPGVLKEVRAKVGDLVKRGDVVAVLRANEWLERVSANEAAIKLAAANLEETKSKLEKTAEKLATTREIYRKDLIARRDVEEMESVARTAEAEKERAQAELAQREAALAQTRYLLGLTKIAAPVSGIVTRRLAEPGGSVAASAAILSIAEPAMMRLAIPLAPADARQLRVGMAATVRAGPLPGKIYKGTVSNVNMAVEKESTGPTAEIEILNPDGLLKPALEVAVSVPLAGARELIVVPRAAVFGCEGKRCVYVVDGRRAQLRSVGTGTEISGETVVTSNLEEGEKVVVAADKKIQPESYIHIVD